MTSNSLSIHIESRDIIYNFDTGENFYNLLMVQQSLETVYVPKKFLYANSSENYIFFQFIHMLAPDEIQQLDDDIKSNGWGC